MKVTVSHCQAVWETARFTVEVPAGRDPAEYVAENLDELLGRALAEGRCSLENGDAVAGVETSLYIYDEAGAEIAAGDEADDAETDHDPG